MLVLRGEAGVGKSALLNYAIESAPDLRIMRAVGIESEMELAFAALHQLCAPLLDRMDRLPGPQRAALAVTFGLLDGPVPDRFIVGLAVLGLLSDAADRGAVLCVVDDAQWLDKASAQVLAFVARRLAADPVGMLFSARELGAELLGLPELVVEGLAASYAFELLRSVVPGRLDERVRERVVAETRGNPLALLELTRGLSAAQLAAGFGEPGSLPLEGRVQERFLDRLETLPLDSQHLLLLAAVEPTGDAALLWRAAHQLGIPRSALEPAEAAGLIEVGAAVWFRHPLVRTAVYRAASPQLRRTAHRTLADATDHKADPDRRAWHLAEAATGLDEGLAAELERSAERAHARGGFIAAAALLERAVALSSDPSTRADRALAAAYAKVLAGALDAVEVLLAAAASAPLTDVQNARADLIRAQLAYVTRRGNDAPQLLLRAAGRLEAVAPELARSTYLDALSAALFAGHLAAPGGSVGDVLSAAGKLRGSNPSASDLFLEGMASTLGDGYASGLPILRRALDAFERLPSAAPGPPGAAHKYDGYAFLAAKHLWDDAACATITEQWATRCRESGALTDLPLALTSKALILLFAGDLEGATTLVDELRAAMEATGIAFAPYAALGLVAFQGNQADGALLIDAAIRDAYARGEGQNVSAAEWANAVLNNGLGRYEQALAAARRAGESRWDIAFSSWALPELVEAAARLGKVDDAAPAVTLLTEIAHASRSEWALGIDARSRALLSEGDLADNLYAEAIRRLGNTHVRVELARAHLLYGEWLRRERRRVDAREQLRSAFEMFTIMGVAAFARRAERELLATGERLRKRNVETRSELTAQEARIARLARDGVSNPEIATRLFISTRTVEYHLGKVFNKLDVTSRHELARVLPSEQSPALPS